MSSDTDDIDDRILEVLHTVLRCDVTAHSSRATLLNWDSLKNIELMFALEDEFSIQFDEDELATLDSVPTISRAIKARRAA